MDYLAPCDVPSTGLHDPGRQIFENFLRVITPLEGAYSHAGFTYVAIKDGDCFRIHHARLFLSTTGTPPPSMLFQTESIQGGRLLLKADLKLTVRQFAEQLIAGRLETPHGILHFPAPDGGWHGVEYVPFHPEGLQSQQRYSVFKLISEPHQVWRQPDLDWELKAASSDAPDIIATTPLGNFVVVECTTGLLRQDHKLANLYDRVQALRQRLATSQLSSTSVLPAIVTSKPRAHVSPDIEQAERDGILVVTQETIISAIDRTLVLPNTDQLFQEAIQSVQAAQSRALARASDIQTGE